MMLLSLRYSQTNRADSLGFILSHLVCQVEVNFDYRRSHNHTRRTNAPLAGPKEARSLIEFLRPPEFCTLRANQVRFLMFRS